MKNLSLLILRIGLGITFLWIGILIWQNPESWGGYLQPWAVRLLPVPLTQAMLSTAVLDIAVGGLLILGWWAILAAAVGALHLLVILITSGITDITIRDVGLLAAALALIINLLSEEKINKIKSKFIKRSD